MHQSKDLGWLRGWKHVLVHTCTSHTTLLDFPLTKLNVIILYHEVNHVPTMPCNCHYLLFFVFPLLLLIFPLLSLIFVRLVTVCLGVFLLGFILPGTFCASWTWLTVSFSILRTFSAIVSSDIFSGPFSLSSPSGTPIMWILVHLMLSRRSQYVLISFHSFFCILLHGSDLHQSILQVIYPFFCLSYYVVDFF